MLVDNMELGKRSPMKEKDREAYREQIRRDAIALRATTDPWDEDFYIERIAAFSADLKELGEENNDRNHQEIAEGQGLRIHQGNQRQGLLFS